MSSLERERIRLAAPRILKAPPRWKFSHLKKSCLPARADASCDVKIGVRCARGRIRWAASRTNSGLTVRLAGSFELKIVLAHPAHPVLIFVQECRDTRPVIAAYKQRQERN